MTRVIGNVPHHIHESDDGCGTAVAVVGFAAFALFLCWLIFMALPSGTKCQTIGDITGYEARNIGPPWNIRCELTLPDGRKVGPEDIRVQHEVRE